ncbi:RmlC-like cupin domain-containing protein [Aspergillus karnatakaensis]|uniref:germin family protein n=1 Tax=Aspergillus karnatakaensis TaxID=1810916 RepID=UPI003CCDBA6E
MRLTQAASISLLASCTLAVPTAPSSSPSNHPHPSHPDTSIDDILPPIVPINPRSGDPDFIRNLVTTATNGDRVALLDQPGDYIFDFNPATAPEAAVTTGQGGSAVAANAKTFPSLIRNGAAMTLGFLDACGMNTAHVHNRATELNVVVKGRLVTNMVIENGAAPIENTLETFQMANFPQGSIHQQFNPDCEEMVFVAGFNSEDPGTGQIAQNFFNLRGDVVSATLGGVQTFDGRDLESFKEMIPANVALGIQACLDKCGLKRNAKRDLRELVN